jgi:hypothetical protein
LKLPPDNRLRTPPVTPWAAGFMHPMKAGIAHGVTGGVRSRLSGGSFKSGFLGSAVSYGASWSGAVTGIDPG